MRFIVDAQLPRRLAGWLAARGHDVLHTLDLPDGNSTPDAAIVELAGRENRIVVTKDADFVNSHLLTGRPASLLLVATGNMGNAQLQRLLEDNIEILEDALASHRFIELGRDSLVIHA
jgi:predicted nuclease of predicted toxin-antitoxin system